eukprot:TRINITY_DN24_c0_g1_i1.p1 TRINITY_DN24_c0_g1~~TRINITY_DN24_c0_g1_i1.p1  ORF type:complete len:323 (-),score=81.45 TRINITY_DN24_c0_g1_i1:101-1069(-)
MSYRAKMWTKSGMGGWADKGLGQITVSGGNITMTADSGTLLSVNASGISSLDRPSLKRVKFSCNGTDYLLQFPEESGRASFENEIKNTTSSPVAAQSSPFGVSSNSNITCFKCNQTGHFANACPNQNTNPTRSFGNPVTCFKCGQVGHFASACPSSTASTTSSGFGGGGFNRNVTCYKCNQQGHFANACPGATTSTSTPVVVETPAPAPVVESEEKKQWRETQERVEKERKESEIQKAKENQEREERFKRLEEERAKLVKGKFVDSVASLESVLQGWGSVGSKRASPDRDSGDLSEQSATPGGDLSTPKRRIAKRRNTTSLK